MGRRRWRRWRGERVAAAEAVAVLSWPVRGRMQGPEEVMLAEGVEEQVEEVREASSLPSLSL